MIARRRGRKYDIPPDVIDLYLGGRRELLSSLYRLSPEEAAVLALLHQGFHRDKRMARP
jgi:hypothetical protein